MSDYKRLLSDLRLNPYDFTYDFTLTYETYDFNYYIRNHEFQL